MPEKEKDDVDNVVQANRFHVQGLGFKCACVCPFVCVCVCVCVLVYVLVCVCALSVCDSVRACVYQRTACQ